MPELFVIWVSILFLTMNFVWMASYSGEAQGRIIVTLAEEDQDDFFDICDANKVGAVLLGHVTKGKIVVDEKHFGFCSELRAYYDNGFEEALDL